MPELAIVYNTEWPTVHSFCLFDGWWCPTKRQRLELLTAKQSEQTNGVANNSTVYVVSFSPVFPIINPPTTSVYRLTKVLASPTPSTLLPPIFTLLSYSPVPTPHTGASGNRRWLVRTRQHTVFHGILNQWWYIRLIGKAKKQKQTVKIPSVERFKLKFC